jgi:glycogen synthase
MKVLMFGWEFPPHISGGLGTACFGLTRGLAANNVDVLFVVPKVFGDENVQKFRLIPANDIDLPGAAEDVKLLQKKLTFYGVSSAILPYLSPSEFQIHTEEKQYPAGENQRFSPAARFQLTGKYGKDLMQEVWQYALVAGEIARENSFDVIHAHDWLSFPAGIMAKEISGKPLIIHVHATEYDRSGENINPQVFEIEKQGVHAADKIITVSEFTRQILLSRYQVPAHKVATVHNAVEPQRDIIEERVPHPFKEKIISYLGRVTFQKGPEYFIDASVKLLKKDKNIRFIMAGNGDMYYRMIKKVAGHRISSHFHFTGFLNRNAVNKIFSMSDVYVMPSVSEPFGISPLEAIRAGVPVIVSRQSGVTEVLKHAIKIDFWDTDALADAMFALTRFRSLSGMFVREGKKDIANLKWETQALKIKNLYEQL